MTTVISWLYLGYFLILSAERIQSLFRTGGEHLFASGFGIYVNLLTMLSLLASVVLLAARNGRFWRSLFDRTVTPDYSILSVTAGVLLVSGMVHTEYTIAPVQFIAYGMIIAAMILRTVQTTRGVGAVFPWWYSLLFLTAFSMAIPVVYPSEMDHAARFYIIEATVSLVLVISFTLLLRRVMTGSGADLLQWFPMLVAACGNAVILAMQWKEKVNLFVLVFTALSAFLFAVGKIIFGIRKKGGNAS